MEFDEAWQFVSYLSTFDHWLTEQEASESKIMFYGLAKKHNLLEAYLLGEQKFIRFYQDLDNQVIDLAKGNSEILSTNSAEFLQILQNGLREKSHFNLYFPNTMIQSESNFDRTNILFSRCLENVRILKNLAKKNQLHIIETIKFTDFKKFDL